LVKRRASTRDERVEVADILREGGEPEAHGGADLLVVEMEREGFDPVRTYSATLSVFRRSVCSRRMANFFPPSLPSPKCQRS
jgi:hypothetical protein